VGLKPVYVTGDVTQPRGSGTRIIAFNVNDKALSWGKGVSRSVASKWPYTQEAFQQWVFKEKSALRLGNTFKVPISDNLWAFQLVCQHGYGPSPTSRIRYGALKSCLDGLAKFAAERNASVHIPRLGSGEGGAIWDIVSQIVDETLCRAGIPVTVYDLPNAKPQQAPELPGLFTPRVKF
jgi:O-acetyl-ADP-ribose deacetylase (regulator of RNase III)